MAATESNNKTIAKNTLFLYFRMMFTMIVSLYTSRVVLQYLGVEDFGIYQTVGGLVGLLSFVNSALAAGSSRFLTFELGKGDDDILRRTFSTVLTAHILLALCIVIVLETAGLWFVYHKLVIPDERMDAAVFAYHISVVAIVFHLVQVPYNASIISHEKMGIYAYTSIVEVVLRLLIVYLLTIEGFDKLRLYSILSCSISILLFIYYRQYCVRNFNEAHYKPFVDRTILREVVSYSGWNLFASVSVSLVNQGATVLMNVFFTPSVVAARAIANQVNMAANQFINNFRTAANPQIIKRYAAKDYDGSRNLLILSTKMSYYIMLALALPIALLSEPLLQIWLGQIPDFAVVFLQITIITSLFQVFDSSFYVALYAKGRIKENAIISPSIDFIAFGITALLYYLGYSPVVYSITLLIAYIIQGLVIKPVLIKRIVDYSYKEIFNVILNCLNVTLFALPIPLLGYFYIMRTCSNMYVQFFFIVIVSVICVGLSSWFVGLDKYARDSVRSLVKQKIAFSFNLFLKKK